MYVSNDSPCRRVSSVVMQSLKMQLIVTTILMVPVTYILAVNFLPEE